jgi:hypothetical protein
LPKGEESRPPGLRCALARQSGRPPTGTPRADRSCAHRSPALNRQSPAARGCHPPNPTHPPHRACRFADKLPRRVPSQSRAFTRVATNSDGPPCRAVHPPPPRVLLRSGALPPVYLNRRTSWPTGKLRSGPKWPRLPHHCFLPTTALVASSSPGPFHPLWYRRRASSVLTERPIHQQR